MLGGDRRAARVAWTVALVATDRVDRGRLCGDRAGGRRLCRAQWAADRRRGVPPSIALPLAQKLGRSVLGFATNLIDVVLVPILSLPLIKDAAAMRRAFLETVSTTGHAGMWRRIVVTAIAAEVRAKPAIGTSPPGD